MTKKGRHVEQTTGWLPGVDGGLYPTARFGGYWEGAMTLGWCFLRDRLLGGDNSSGYIPRLFHTAGSTINEDHDHMNQTFGALVAVID